MKIAKQNTANAYVASGLKEGEASRARLSRGIGC